MRGGEICSIGLKYLYHLYGNKALNKLKLLYVSFVMAYLKENEIFKRNFTYSGTAKGFNSINQEIYQDNHYMQSYLLPLLFSYAFFPHHYKQYIFFKKSIQFNVLDKSAKCIDFGCGHGLFSLSLLKDSERFCESIDISPTSVEMTSFLLSNQVKNKSRYQCFLHDATKYVPKGKKYDFFVCAGLLEHIEKPGEFIKFIKRFLSNQGVIFVMLPINVPLPDHIIHFKDLADIRYFFKDCELEVIDERVIPTELVPAEEALRNKTPTTYICICKGKCTM